MYLTPHLPPVHSQSEDFLEVTDIPPLHTSLHLPSVCHSYIDQILVRAITADINPPLCHAFHMHNSSGMSQPLSIPSLPIL